MTWNGYRSTVCKTPANGGTDDPVQCNALVDLANATGWTSWSANGVRTGWLSATSYCSWPGVTCAGVSLQNGKLMVTNSKIVGLSINVGTGFPNNVLVGTLPSTLGSLTSLTSFSITLQPLLTGTIPSTLLALTSLTYLQITQTGLTYQLNSFLQSVSAMTQLKTLYVDGYYSGGWCPPTAKCTLQSLPSSISALQLANLGLSGVVRSLPPSLTYLNLYSNPLITTFSTAAAIAANNVFGGCYLGNISFTCLPSVLLNSGRCLIDNRNQVPACAATATSFNCSSSNSPMICSALSDFYSATGGTSWSTSTGWSSAASGIATDYCTFYGVGCYGGALTSLSLVSNQLNGTIPSSISGLSTLASLVLTSNMLYGSIPFSMGGLTALSTLYLNQNQFSGTIPTSLGSLTQMTGLITLDGNQLTGTIPPSLGSLTGLFGFYASSNQLNGTIPSSLGSMTSLRALCLDHNQLSGSIPSSLSGLNLSNQLLLAASGLCGTVPMSRQPDDGALPACPSG